MKVAAEVGAAANGGVAVVEVGTAAEAVELSSAGMIGAAVAETVVVAAAANAAVTVHMMVVTVTAAVQVGSSSSCNLGDGFIELTVLPFSSTRLQRNVATASGATVHQAVY